MDIAAGAQVVVRDEEWLVRSVTTTERDGARIEVTGISELVRDQDAVFYENIEKIAAGYGTAAGDDVTTTSGIEVLDPRATKLVGDDTPAYRKSRLWLESMLRQAPAPSADSRILVGNRALLDPLNFQLRPAELALQNLRPRILIGDAVGLGKTLEIGIVLAELIRRGRGERILVVTPRAVLEQFQHELWTRFAIPLIRLDSDGIQRVRRDVPADRNPFSYYRRAIVSIDTLKNPAKYRHHLQHQHWDAVVIDECHNLINAGTQNNQLARLLAQQTDALILSSATPHNGKPESFAELVSMLDPAAITDKHHYTADDIQHLYVRRHRNSPDVKSQVGHSWAQRREPAIINVPASPAEEAVLAELDATWLHPSPQASVLEHASQRLVPWGFLKSFLSSPAGLTETLGRRAKSTTHEPEQRALKTLQQLTAAAENERPSKLTALLKYLTSIGITAKGLAAKDNTRIVIFSERIRTLHYLRDELTKALNITPQKGDTQQIEVLHATIGDRETQRIVEQFSLERSPLRILLSSDMASEGINLHRQCHHLVHYDLPWSFIRIQQRNGRIDRYLQTHEPQISALALTSSDPGINSELQVVTKLLQKEYVANQALGDAGVLLDVHNEKVEEETVMKAMASGDDLDTLVPDPGGDASGVTSSSGQAGSPGSTTGAPGSATGAAETTAPAMVAAFSTAAAHPFSWMLAAGAQHETSPVPEIAQPPTLFADDDNYLSAALAELYPDQKKLNVSREENTDLLAFDTPTDLLTRLRNLPDEYLRDRDVETRMRLSANTGYAEARLAKARSEGDTLWPDVHFLAALHPVLDWVASRSLARLGRNEAPVMAGNVAGAVFLTQAVWSGPTGRPIIGWWGAVTGLPDDPDVDELQRAAWQAGITENAINPGASASVDLAPLQRLVPVAIDAATADLFSRRQDLEAGLQRRLAEREKHLAGWQQQALFDAEQLGTGTRRRKDEIYSVQATMERWIADLRPTGEPYVRVVGVIAPGGSATDQARIAASATAPTSSAPARKGAQQ